MYVFRVEGQHDSDSTSEGWDDVLDRLGSPEPVARVGILPRSGRSATR